jgi:hypothetical protein
VCFGIASWKVCTCIQDLENACDVRKRPYWAISILRCVSADVNSSIRRFDVGKVCVGRLLIGLLGSYILCNGCRFLQWICVVVCDGN